MVVSSEWPAKRQSALAAIENRIDRWSVGYARAVLGHSSVRRVFRGRSDGCPNGSCTDYPAPESRVAQREVLRDIACDYLRVTVALLSHISFTHGSFLRDIHPPPI